MGLRWLLMAVLLGVVYLIWRARRRPSTPESQDPDPSGDAVKPAGPPQAPVVMVVCAHCQVHLPQGEACWDAQGHPFCSSAHRRASQARDG